MNILMIGDVYAKPGREILKKYLPKITKENEIDFIVANGENVTHGKSIAYQHYLELKNSNINVITSGNHIFKNAEVIKYIDQTPDLLKPLNMNKETPGNGYVIKTVKNKKICVLNLMGNSFMDYSNNVYDTMDYFLNLNLEYDILLVDFHAETTAEKIAFALNYDGQITAFVGTHTHVQTADERILPNKTAFITDLGMTGTTNSVIGVKPQLVIKKQKTGLPSRFEPDDSLTRQICGVIIKVDDKTNQAVDIKRIFIKEN